MTLTESIQNMRKMPSQENNKVFADFFRGMVDDNTQVYTTAKAANGGYSIDTAEHSGNVYVIMYSDSGKVRKPEGSSMCTIGISNLIDSCYANPHIMGIVINPDEDPVYMQRKDLQILSGKEDPRLADRDWGVGIPEYTDADLMVAEEAIDFAMEVVAAYGLQPQGYELIESNNGLTAFPNFVVKKDNKLYFVSVDVTLAPNVPKLNKDIVPKLIEIAEPYGADILYAPVSFASADEERSKAGLALVGDQYIGNFLGFMEIYKDEKEKK